MKLSIIEKNISKRSKNDLKHKTSTEISKSNNQKNISFSKDERFTTIEIDSKYQSDNECETHVKTRILKDKILNTTETHIKKIFLNFHNGKTKVIVREIFIDRFNKQSKKEHRSIYLKLDNQNALPDQLAMLFASNQPKLQLN